MVLPGKMFLCIVILTAVLLSPCRCQDLNFTIDEELPAGTLVGRVSEASSLQAALSQDIMKTLRYSFLTQGYSHSVLFNISKSSGQISTAKRLDREEICGFNTTCLLDLDAAVQSSTSQLFAIIHVRINLQDINDNKPVFPQSSVSLTVSEATPVNSLLLCIAGAVDRDTGNNSLLRYELISSYNPFSLNVVQNIDGGTCVNLVLTRTLDREMTSSYSLVVLAIDGGNPPLTGSATVNIGINDVNDNAPVFTSPRYNVNVNETTSPNTPILSVMAVDADEAFNGVSYYRFGSRTSADVRKYFDVNATSGDITVISSLKMVKGATFVFSVECVDKGIPPRIGQAQVSIYVEDTNNSAPTINVTLLNGGHVSRYAHLGTVVADMRVIDLDNGRNGIVTCRIASDVFMLQAFDVNEFKVIVAQPLDNRTETSFVTNVTCVDAGTPPLTTSTDFTVDVIEENAHSPVFSRDVYTGSVAENTKDVVITAVSGTDSDKGLNGEIDYIIPFADKMGLKVMPNGDVIATKEFDREDIPKLRVPIVASDRGNPPRNTTAMLVITINDVNDEVPTFEFPHYKFKVQGNQAPGAVIGTLHASDADSGLNGQVSYTIDAGASDLPIEILCSGQLRTLRVLDRQTVKEYKFKVWARDSGVPSLQSFCTVEVEVEMEEMTHTTDTSPNTSQ